MLNEIYKCFLLKEGVYLWLKEFSRNLFGFFNYNSYENTNICLCRRKWC